MTLFGGMEAMPAMSTTLHTLGGNMGSGFCCKFANFGLSKRLALLAVSTCGTASRLIHHSMPSLSGQRRSEDLRASRCPGDEHSIDGRSVVLTAPLGLSKWQVTKDLAYIKALACD